MGIDDTKAEIARCDDSPTDSFKDDNLYRGLIYDTYYRRIHPQREMANPESVIELSSEFAVRFFR